MKQAAIYIRHDHTETGAQMQQAAVLACASRAGYLVDPAHLYLDEVGSVLVFDNLIGTIKAWQAQTEFQPFTALFVSSYTRFMHPRWGNDRNVARVQATRELLHQHHIKLFYIYSVELLTTAEKIRREKQRIEEAVVGDEQMYYMTRNMRTENW